jgi:HEAT repeat protein
MNWLVAAIFLMSGDANDRLLAVKSLMGSTGPGLWMLLNRAAQDRDVRVRLAALTALGLRFGAKAVGLLIGALQNEENEDVRIHAADLLVQIGQEAVTPLINTLIISQTRIDPTLPAQTLVRIGGSQVVSSLITLMKAQEPIIDLTVAAQVLGRIGGLQTFSRLIELREDPRESVRQAAAEALEIIGGQIHSKNAGERLAAVKALDVIGGSQVAESLVQALDDEDPAVSWEAALTLEKNPNRDAVMTQVSVFERIKGDIPGVAYLLGQYGEPDVVARLQKHVPSIIEQLNSQNPIQRWAAVKALDVIGGSEAVGALVEVLNDPDDRVSYAIAKALARRGDAATIQAKLSEWEASEKGKEYKDNEAVNTLVAASAALNSTELRRYTEDKSEEVHKNIRAQLEAQLNKLLDRYAPDTFGG